MAIKVKHDGNATPTAFASAQGGMGKRSQQDAASMASVMQQAANSGNQQLRGASAPGATPGRANAQLIHANAPVGSAPSIGMNAYNQGKLLDKKFEYDKALKQMGIEGDLAKISRTASETRGTNTWNARVQQAQHPDVPENSNQTVDPLRPDVMNNDLPTNDQNSFNKESPKTVKDSLDFLVINQPMGNLGTTINEALGPLGLRNVQQRLNQTLVDDVNKLKRGKFLAEKENDEDLLSRLISQFETNNTNQNAVQQQNDIMNTTNEENGVDLKSEEDVDLDESNAFTKKKSLYDNDADYGFMNNIFSVI